MGIFFKILLVLCVFITLSYAKEPMPKIPKDVVIFLKQAEGEQTVQVFENDYHYFDTNNYEIMEQFVNSVFLEIFSTKTGKLVVKQIIEDFIKQKENRPTFDLDYQCLIMRFYHVLGVWGNTTEKLINQIDNKYEAKNDFEKPIDTFMLRGNNIPIGKKQYILLRPFNEVDLWVDSFTHKNNFTIIYLNKESYDLLYWIKVFSHEAAISFDNKANLSHHFRLEKYSIKNKKWLIFLNDPLVNFAFSVVRAWRFEALIVRDLQKKYKFEVDEMTKYMGNHFDNALCEEMFFLAMNLLVEHHPEGKFRVPEITKDYKDLTRWNFSRKLNCKYFATPYLGDRLYDTEGPKPRVRGWKPPKQHTGYQENYDKR